MGTINYAICKSTNYIPRYLYTKSVYFSAPAQNPSRSFQPGHATSLVKAHNVHKSPMAFSNFRINIFQLVALNDVFSSLTRALHRAE